MAKAKMNNPKRPLAPKEKLLLQESIGGAIPTPTEVENIRRPSQAHSKLVMEGSGENVEWSSMHYQTHTSNYIVLSTKQ